MCRLFAAIRPEEKEVKRSLEEFGLLAEYGVISPGTTKGHPDGWGVVAWKGSEVGFFEKKPDSAFHDTTYLAAVREIAKMGPTLVLAHLRKASIGKNAIENTQPYLWDGYCFCHNGTVHDFEKLSLEPAFRRHLKGTTDSEAVFFWLLQEMARSYDAKEGFMRAAKHIASIERTAANILLSDGKMLYTMRDVNENDETVRKGNLCDTYYTLYQGKDGNGKTRFICSQKIETTGISWIQIPNHSVLVIDLATSKEEQRTLE